MKKNTKIITLALSVAVLLCAVIGFTVNAGAAAPEVVAKNVKTNGNFCLMFAVDPATVAGDDVTLKIYDKTPAEGVDPIQTFTKAKTDTVKIDYDKDGVENEDMIVFDTNGVSAKDIADNWYYTVESAGAVSDVATYSVREYAFERLYGDNKIAAEDSYGIRQREFYLSILEVGSTAQDLLVNAKLEAAGKAPERLANEYAYASIFNGSFGETTQQFVEIGDTLTLTANAGVNAWQIITYGTNGVVLSKESVLNGATITVAGNTVVVPDPAFGTTPGKYFAQLGDELYNFDNVSSLTNGNSGITSFRLGNANDMNTRTDYCRGIIETRDGHGKVIGIEKADHSNVGPLIHIPVIDYANGNGNVVVLETEIFIEKGEYQYDDADISRGYLGNAIYFQWLDKTYVEMKSNTWDGTKGIGNRLFAANLDIVDSDGILEEKIAGADGTYNNFTDKYVDTVGGDCFRVNKSKNEKDMDFGKWYKLTYEFYFDVGKAVAYVDGEVVSIWTITPSDTMVATANSVSVCGMYRFRNCKFVIDNVFSGKIVKDYPF